MDHVINSMREWLLVYEDRDKDGWRDEKAVKCIKNAIKELNKYYNYTEQRGNNEE